MKDMTLARVVHVVAVIVWIGSVFMVTTVIIPAVRRLASKEDQIKTFADIEGRFAWYARIATALTGLSGFYMMYALDAWDRYLDYRYWWVTAMTLVWLLFTLILFILEPFVLHKLFRRYVERNPEKAFLFMYRMHWILLIISLITVIGAVAGSHGWFFL